MNRAMRTAARIAMPLRDPSLTVLCYHRVDTEAGHGLGELVTSPSRFEEHLDLLQEDFNIVEIDDLLAWLGGSLSLPPRAAMITLDDGYRDNFTFAYPLLKRRGLPATIFLATDHVGSDEPFWWDFASFVFDHASGPIANLPLLGRRDLNGSDQRREVAKTWIEAAKRVSDADRRKALLAMEKALQVEVPQGAFSGMHLSWNQVHEMSSNGISFGAHSITHPILSRLGDEGAAFEISGSIDRVHAELGVRPRTFAYPNGGSQDFTVANQEVLRDEGVVAAFALSSGPAVRLADAGRQPLAIDRVYIDASDTAERVAFKLTDLQRIAHWRGVFGR